MKKLCACGCKSEITSGPFWKKFYSQKCAGRVHMAKWRDSLRQKEKAKAANEPI